MEANHNQTVSPELREKLSKIKHLALDMDGTLFSHSQRSSLQICLTQE